MFSCCLISPTNMNLLSATSSQLESSKHMTALSPRSDPASSANLLAILPNPSEFLDPRDFRNPLSPSRIPSTASLKIVLTLMPKPSRDQPSSLSTPLLVVDANLAGYEVFTGDHSDLSSTISLRSSIF